MEIERPKKSDIMGLMRNFKTKAVPSELTRPESSNYKNLSEQFLLKENQKKYTQQYWKTYQQRLSQIKQYFVSNFNDKGIPLCDKILNIKPGEFQVVVTTLYKQMTLKPSALTETEYKENYMQDSDKMFMEDQTGRMQIEFNNTIFNNPIGSETILNEKNLITGVVAGLRGIQRTAEINVFEVQEIYCCDLPHQENILNLPPPQSIPNAQSIATPLKSATPVNNNGNYKSLKDYFDNSEGSKFILFCSGLNIDPSIDKFQVEQLRYHLLGQSNLKQLMSKVCRVVIAGNLIEKKKEIDYNLVGAYRMQEQFKSIYSEITHKMKEADKQIHCIQSSVNVDLMAGDKDPTQAFLPQQPLSKCYFASSISNNSALQLVSNPYKFEEESITLLGFSGQNLQDAKKYSNYGQNDIDILESQILWRHIAPTAPDTLQCFPFVERDPFVVDELPHVYFVGNTQHFETRLIYEQTSKKRCRLICVPALSTANSFVLLNLANLDTFEVQI